MLGTLKNPEAGSCSLTAIPEKTGIYKDFSSFG